MDNNVILTCMMDKIAELCKNNRYDFKEADKFDDANYDPDIDPFWDDYKKYIIAEMGLSEDCIKNLHVRMGEPGIIEFYYTFPETKMVTVDISERLTHDFKKRCFGEIPKRKDE